MTRLQPHEITFIAEDLGARSPPPLRYLTVLARHASSVVREGVVYGLARHASAPSASAALLALLNDLSTDVRVAAREALES